MATRGIFDDLPDAPRVPGARPASSRDPFADLPDEPAGAGRLPLFANVAARGLEGSRAMPQGQRGPFGTVGAYAGEFGRAIGQGAADLGGMVLKGGAALQTAASRDMVRFADRQLKVIDRIERGESIDPSDDVYGYAKMPAPERLATRQRLTRRLTEFDLPGPATGRDLFKAGELVSEAGRKAFPISPGWEESTTVALGKGLGSVVGGLPIALAGPGAAAIAFGTAGSGEALERASREGATDDEQLKAALLGIAPGTTDVVPIELLMGRLPVPQPFRRPLAQALGRIGGQAFVEGIQEGGQEFLQNLIAREVYKPGQSLTEGIVPSAELGAGVGGIAGTAREMIRLLAGGRRRGAITSPEPEAETAPPQLPAAPWSPDAMTGEPQPLLALTARGDRLAYSGGGEATRKFQRVDKTALEGGADRLTREVRAYEDESRASGAGPEQIAQGINQKFGFDTTADEISSGNVWWRLDDAIAKETGRGPRGRFAGIALPPDAETAMRREWRNLSNLEISSRLQREFGLNVRREHVSEIRNRLGYPAKTRERDDVLPGEVEKALRSEEFSRLTHAEAQVELRDRFGLERSRQAVRMLRERRGLEAPSARVPTPLSPDAEAFLRLPEAAALSNEAAAAVLRERFGIDLSYKTIERRRRQLDLPDVDARLIWSPEEIAWVQRPETKGMSRKTLVEEFYERFGRRVTEKAMESRRGKVRAAIRARGETPDFALTADEIGEQKAELARQWGVVTRRRAQQQDAEPALGDIWEGIRAARDLRSSPVAGGARPINWQHGRIRNLLEGRGRAASSRGDFPWPPDALQMLRAGEGRQSFTDMAAALTGKFGHRVTPEMVGGKVRRLRQLAQQPFEDRTWGPGAKLELARVLKEEPGLSIPEVAAYLSAFTGRHIRPSELAAKIVDEGLPVPSPATDREPMLASRGDDPSGWFSQFKRFRNARARDLEAARQQVAAQGGKPAGRAPGTHAAVGTGAGRPDHGRARASAQRFEVGRYRGLVVETPNVVAGLRQRRYYLYPENSQLPSLARSPQVVQRVLRASRNWIAKAHVNETAPGQWQVLGINVRRNRQRRGIGGQIYDALSRDLGVELGPSPSMTRQLHRFWERRAPGSVADYRRIGDTYHSPESLRALKRVNDAIRHDPSSARERAQAERFADQIEDALESLSGQPEAAIGGDIEARRNVGAFLRSGRAVTIPAAVVNQVNAVLEENAHAIPEGTRAGALSRIEPLKGEPSYPEADTLATFTAPDGSTFQLELPWSFLRQSRALYDIFTDSLAITRFGRFGSPEQFVEAVRGEIHHEAVHSLRRKGLLGGAAWGRLVSHAGRLRLLDSEARTYLQMVGDPAADKVGAGTMREAYERAYQNTTDRAERMDQEAVAHMAELYAHGELLPQEVAPVRDLLDQIMAGEVSAGAGQPGRSAVPGLPMVGELPSSAIGDAAGQSYEVTTPGGEMQVRASPEVVELSDLRLAAGDLQPRDRSRAESMVGVRERATSLDASRLLLERVSDSGAPIVARDGTIISGNGRALSIAEVYKDPALKSRADQYRATVLTHADQMGLGQVARAMHNPVLVSRIAEDLSQVELARFADLSNRSSIAQMSATERAQRDVRAVGPDVMGLYRGGSFTSLENREFFRAFTDLAVTPNERGAFSRDGVLTREGEDRLSGAVLAAAYGDAALLTRLLESTDDNIRNVTGAMRDAAGAFVRLKDAIAAREVAPQFDVTPQVAEAARLISDLRERGVKLPTFLAQQDAFRRLDPIVEDLLRAFYNPNLTRALSREKLTELLSSYADEAVRHKESGLIPDETTPADVIRFAARKAARTTDDLLADRPGAARGPDAGGRQAHGRQGARGYGQAPGTALAPGQVAPPPLARSQVRPPPLPGLRLPPSPPRGGSGGLPPLIPRGPRGPRPVPNPALVRALNSYRARFMEFWQNSDERMRILVDRVGRGSLPDTADPYLKATLYYGRVGARVRYGHDAARAVLTDLARLARSSRAGYGAMRGHVNDYLIARHAPERNAQHGDGAAGITTADAQRLLARINARPDAAEIRALADRIANLHGLSLDVLLDAQVISPQLHSGLRATYRHHVPLNRIIPDAPDVGGAIAGRGFDVYSSGIKRAKGSDLEVDDILGNVLANYEQAILRAEKNLVDLSSLEFMRRHRSDLAGLMTGSRPPIIGQGAGGRPIFQQSSDPHVLHMFEHGRPVWIRFTDARLASAFKATNRDRMPATLRFVAAFTRLYSGLQTRFNPEFALPNKLRDMQEVMVYMASQRRIGFRGAARTVARDPASIKAVTDFIAGRNTPGARLYAEMQDAGGTTGGMALSTRQQVELDVGKLDRLAQSSPRRLAQGFVELVDHWNTVFEDSTRLSVYRAARDRGLSRDRAAFLAKEASVNFNRMGTAGPIVNALYMFSNASIQGSVKMIRSLRNPKVGAAVGVAVAAAVAAVAEWNDEIDPDWREKVSKWDRLNSLPIVLPSEDGDGVRYVSIPVSWGLKPLMVTAAVAYDAASGVAVDMGQAVSDILLAIVEGYNPAGGTDLWQALMPTIGDTPLDVARNRKWSGGKLRPDFDQSLPADKRYFLSLKDTQSGRLAIRSTDALHDYTGIAVSPSDLAYAVEQYAGGAGRTARKSLDTIIGTAKGEPPPADEFPMLSRFYRKRTGEEVGGGSPFMDEIGTRLQGQSRGRFDVRNRADDMRRQIEAMPEGERAAAFQRFLAQDRETGEALAEMLDTKAKGLTFEERAIGRLGVEGGERARYIVSRLQLLDSGKQAELLAAWRRKGLVTNEVMRQVRTLLAGRDIGRRAKRVPMPDFGGRTDPFNAPRAPGGSLFDDLPAEGPQP